MLAPAIAQVRQKAVTDATLAAHNARVAAAHSLGQPPPQAVEQIDATAASAAASQAQISVQVRH
jgi:hypothetical protein